MNARIQVGDRRFYVYVSSSTVIVIEVDDSFGPLIGPKEVFTAYRNDDMKLDTIALMWGIQYAVSACERGSALNV